MVLSQNVPRDGPQRSHLMELPIELHICIRNRLLTDPDTTIQGLRQLRLVCKTFNDIWYPVVLTNMVLFHTRVPNDALAQLRYIIHGKSNTSTLVAYTTLTIKNLYCVDSELDRWFSNHRRSSAWLCDQGKIAVLKWVGTTLILTLVGLVMVALNISWWIAFLPILVAYHMKSAMSQFQARYYMALLPRKLDMPNVRCVRISLNGNDSGWVIYRSTRILLSLPSLTELEIDFAETLDLKYLIRCLAQLNGLHKLTMLPSVMVVPPRIHQCIAALISHNQNLTHFDWRLQLSPDFSALFSDVPTNKPLKLQHLSLSYGYTDFDPLIPHIRSLTSIEFRSQESNRWCISFSRANIYPPTIKVQWLDQELVTFISKHPGLVSLQIEATQETREQYTSLCKALSRHSETLQYLFFTSEALAFILQDEENEANFLQSTGNLRELVLDTDKTLESFQNPITFTYNAQRILQVVAHLNHSLIVVIRDKGIFAQCVAFCRDSEDLLIRHLAGRIVFERV